MRSPPALTSCVHHRATTSFHRATQISGWRLDHSEHGQRGLLIAATLPWRCSGPETACVARLWCLVAASGWALSDAWCLPPHCILPATQIFNAMVIYQRPEFQKGGKFSWCGAAQSLHGHSTVITALYGRSHRLMSFVFVRRTSHAACTCASRVGMAPCRPVRSMVPTVGRCAMLRGLQSSLVCSHAP